MKITIVGLGFVGLSLTSVLSSKGNDILGIDADENKCKNIQKGKSPFFEPDLEKLLRIGLKKKLKISTDFSLIKNSDIIFVTVGTRWEGQMGCMARVLDEEASNINSSPSIVIRSDSESRDCGYPWAIELNDGKVLVAYYYHYADGNRGVEASILEES